MDVFENFENQLKANPKTIVFTEGTDARILSAASKLLAGKILNVLLLGNPEAVKKAADEMESVNQNWTLLDDFFRRMIIGK